MSQSRDMNPASPDNMPSLYHLCHISKLLQKCLKKQAEVLFEVFPQLLPFTRSRLQVEKIKCSKFENLLNDVELLLELHPR